MKQGQQDGVHSKARTTNTSEAPEITPFLSFVSLPCVPNLVISLDWPFFVAPSVFSDVYFNQNNNTL